jgi:hypothetical protein
MPTNTDTSPEGHAYSGLCANLRADHAAWDSPISVAAAEAIEALSADRDALKADVARLRDELDSNARDYCLLMDRYDALQVEVARLRDALSLYSCEDGCNDCPEHERDRVSCGWTARAALQEKYT